MKPCPFCEQPIQVEALKCRHCGEYLRCRYCAAQSFHSQRPPGASAGFGQHLVERGYVTAAQLLDALDRQRQHEVPIGRLALRKGLLTAEQVLRVLDTQQETRTRFGDTAAYLGMLTAAQVEELLREQRTDRPRVGELLLELGALDRDTLQRELDVFLGYALAIGR